MLWNTVPICLQWHRQRWRWLRDPWPQSHMRATHMIMRHPCCQDASPVMFCQRDHEVQAFPPQRAQEPFADRIGLGTSHRGLEHPQPQVAYTLVELLGKDRSPVMDEGSDTCGLKESRRVVA